MGRRAAGPQSRRARGGRERRSLKRRQGVAVVAWMAWIFVLGTPVSPARAQALIEPAAGGPAAEAQASYLSPERVVYEQLQRLPLESLEEFVASLDPETRERLPPTDLGRLIFEGDGIDLAALGRNLLGAFVAEVSLNISLLGQLVLLGVFCALLRNVAATARTAEAADVAFFVSLLVLLILGLQAFRAAVDLAETTVRSMVDFMHAMLPLLATMLAAVGAVTTAAIFHPVLYVTVTGVATLIQSALFPAVLAGAALAVVGSISKDFPVKHLEGLLRAGILTALGLFFIAFFAVVQVRGAIAPVTDGLAFRTAKFLAGTLVPVVGGRIADAMDVIVGGSVLIKNALGVFGMMTIGILTAFPAVKILSILLVFRLATALIEPITDPRLVQAMSGLSGSLSLLLAGLITASLMFFVGITVVVGVGNTAAVMR